MGAILGNMAATGARTLRLLSLLQNHRFWAGQELAGRLDVSVRTLRRDVDGLRELGYAVRSHRGVDGGYQLEAGADMPPLLLDDEEAVGLTVALHTAAGQSAAGIAESSLRALAKLTQVMPPRLRLRVDALRKATDTSQWTPTERGPTIDSTSLVVIAVCCRDAERLRFDHVGPRGEPAERHVEPLRLVSLGRRWYLVAYDLDRQNWRTFRTDRITAPRGTGSRFQAREVPGGDAVAFVRDGIKRTLTMIEVEAVIHAPADVVRRRLDRWATVEAIDETRCRLLMQVDSLDWPALALGSVGSDFTVIRPPELLRLLEGWADRFSRAVNASSSEPTPTAIPHHPPQ